MHWSPQTVDLLSIWEANAAFGGFIKANSPPDDGLSTPEALAVGQGLSRPPPWAGKAAKPRKKPKRKG